MALAVTPVLLNVTAELAVKCVNCPVITTLDTIWPGCPLAVLSEKTTGVPAVTVNLPLPVATSLPVVTVTLLAPVAAPAAIVRVAVRWVASVNVMALAVTPVLLNVRPARDHRSLRDHERHQRPPGPDDRGGGRAASQGAGGRRPPLCRGSRRR